MAKSELIYDAIEAKYGFSIPPEYRAAEAVGWFDLRHPRKRFKPDREPTYLWLDDWNWWKPREILKYEPEEYHKPGLVPFASNNAGDLYGWWPSEDPHAVVSCPHDCETGEFYAPTFLGAIYRNCLDFAHGGIEREEEADARRRLDYWAERLSASFSPRWVETLRAIGRADLVPYRDPRGRIYEGYSVLLSDRRHRALLRRDLNFPRLNEEFQWMRL